MAAVAAAKQQLAGLTAALKLAGQGESGGAGGGQQRHMQPEPPQPAVVALVLCSALPYLLRMLLHNDSLQIHFWFILNPYGPGTNASSSSSHNSSSNSLMAVLKRLKTQCKVYKRSGQELGQDEDEVYKRSGQELGQDEDEVYKRSGQELGQDEDEEVTGALGMALELSSLSEDVSEAVSLWTLTLGRSCDEDGMLEADGGRDQAEAARLHGDNQQQQGGHVLGGGSSGPGSASGGQVRINGTKAGGAGGGGGGASGSSSRSALAQQQQQQKRQDAYVGVMQPLLLQEAQLLSGHAFSSSSSRKAAGRLCGGDAATTAPGGSAALRARIQQQQQQQKRQDAYVGVMQPLLLQEAKLLSGHAFSSSRSGKAAGRLCGGDAASTAPGGSAALRARIQEAQLLSGHAFSSSSSRKAAGCLCGGDAATTAPGGSAALRARIQQQQRRQDAYVGVMQPLLLQEAQLLSGHAFRDQIKVRPVAAAAGWDIMRRRLKDIIEDQIKASPVAAAAWGDIMRRRLKRITYHHSPLTVFVHLAFIIAPLGIRSRDQIKASPVAAAAGGDIMRRRLKRITEEISTLSTSLPLSWESSVFVAVDEDRMDESFVAVYEERMDVLMALIIPSSDTPYSHGFFVFDIYLPPEYPNRPPMVKLLTTGGGRVRFNPNLYKCGKVCLSLLGTWSGPSWEVLVSISAVILVPDPYFNWPGCEHSMATAVLLSISAMILVPDPYFNEPGCERSMATAAGKAASRLYNPDPDFPPP
eukprot:gene21998-29056_t